MSAFDFLETGEIKLSSGKEEKTELKLPWIEKYRPTKIDDVISQDKIVKMLKVSLQNNNLPHLLFYGPPGTGKTSTILAIGRELFGPEMMKQRIIELNASDDRGINAVRNKIKIYAKNAINDNTFYKDKTNNKYPCPPYKIIVLDEADSMTTDAQSALRKIMEDYSQITRFCFICNYISKIIEPISSRCAKFNFLALDNNIMYKKLISISVAEDINCPDSIIQHIIDLSKGDMRKAIMMLQNVKYVQIASGNTVTKTDIMEMNGYMTDDKLYDILNIIKTGSFDQVIQCHKDIIHDGYPLDYLLEQLFDKIIEDQSIDELKKSKMAIHVGQNQKMILDGSDEYLQLLDILTYCHMVIQNKFN